jgi:hypothetical protein
MWGRLMWHPLVSVCYGNHVCDVMSSLICVLPHGNIASFFGQHGAPTGNTSIFMSSGDVQITILAFHLCRYEKILFGIVNVAAW